MPLLSPLFAILVALGSPQAPEAGEATSRADAMPASMLADDALSEMVPGWPRFEAIGKAPAAHQVRIERRVILRVSPQSSEMRRSMFSQLPEQAAPPQLVERPYGECLDASDIVGVSSRKSRLVMYMRDRKIITAELEKACSPRDFYLGFYVERSDDGKLCVDRDRLMSRAGAKCRLASLNRLVRVQR